MRIILTILVAFVAAPASADAAPSPRGKTIPIVCQGAIAADARQVAKANELAAGQHPKACFGKMQIYDGSNHEFVVVIPSAACPGGKALDVYGRSRAGPWYSFFEKPVCGSTLSIGPKNQWGDWILTVDGSRRYHSRGAYYVPVR